jgi:hypothetical protein
MRRITLLLACLSAAALADAQGLQPDPYAARIEMGPESYTWQGVRNSRQSTTGFHAQTPQQTFNTPARRTAAQSGSVAAGDKASGVKPFNHVTHAPTLSPYLNLYREESRGLIPNYHTFVRPMQQQHEANQRQSSQLHQLQRQVRQTSYSTPTSGRSGPARYGDTAHYYSGWQR